MRVSETVRVPATTPGIRAAMDAFDAFGRTQRLTPGATWKVLMAIDELLSNVVRHGGSPRDPGIDLTFAIAGGTLSLEIVDSAPPFNPLLAAQPDVSAALDARLPGGLGIALVRQLSEEARYERRDERNHFTVIWRTDADS